MQKRLFVFSEIKKESVGQKHIFLLGALFYLQKMKWNSERKNRKCFPSSKQSKAEKRFEESTREIVVEIKRKI